MPLPTPNSETSDVFANRCMADSTMVAEYPDSKQRYAVCMAQYDAKKIDAERPLNKPFRTPEGPKKFAVYVKNEKDNVVKVTFGDSDMEIKRDDDERRKNFRSRHQCDTNPGPKWKARYWSCRMWESGKSVSDMLKAINYEQEYETYMAKRRVYSTDGIIHAISSQITGDELPEDIQYLPPGQHDITATKNGKPAELTLTVTARTANLLQKSFDKITSGDREQIFIDFNHDDKEASAWVTKFYWAGDDPETGGVRAKVQWTSKGEEALEGRNYRKFSPTFTLNSKGEIDGTTLNAGGLVNRPAFKDITPIVASEGDNYKTDSQMIDEEKDKKPIASQEEEPKKDETSAMDKLAEKDEEIKSLKAKIKAMEEDKKKEQEVAAQSAVDKAVEDGRIPPKDEKVKAKWVSILEHDPDAVMALNALPVNPAFQRVVQAKRDEGGTIETGHEAQVRATKEIQAKSGMTFDDAWAQCRYERPQLFN
jgi:phage I-like protein